MIMSMKIMKLTAYWGPADAELVISFLDDLRELLVDTYGDEIVDMHRHLTENDALDEDQIELPLDDPLEF
jgi:hypothetical protein